MNKHTYRYFGLVLMLLLVLSACKYDMEYPPGRDTVESIGDGTFQILRTQSSTGLTFEKYNTFLISDIQSTKTENDKVYVYGFTTNRYATDEGTVDVRYTIYAVISLEDNGLQYCAIADDPTARDIYIHRLTEMLKNNDIILLGSFSDFSEEDQHAFQNMA